MFSTKDEDYFVEPLWNHTNNIEKDGHPHVVYKRSSLILPNTHSHCGVKGKFINPFLSGHVNHCLLSYLGVFGEIILYMGDVS